MSKLKEKIALWKIHVRLKMSARKRKKQELENAKHCPYFIEKD